jgi:hypothetical protein
MALELVLGRNAHTFIPTIPSNISMYFFCILNANFCNIYDNVDRDMIWWKAVVDAKYGSTRAGWCSLDPPGSHGVGLWKNIRKGWSLLCSHTGLILGNGFRIRFWDDVWCGEVAP